MKLNDGIGSGTWNRHHEYSKNNSYEASNSCDETFSQSNETDAAILTKSDCRPSLTSLPSIECCTHICDDESACSTRHLDVALEKRVPNSSSSQLSTNVFAVAVSILLYSIISLSIVYFNWWLFSRVISYPVFVSWMQQVVGLILFIILGLIGRKSFFPSLTVMFPTRVPNIRLLAKIAPLTFTFVGMVGFANICLKFVQVSTYQVARSLTIFFTMAFSFFILGEVHSLSTMGACGLIVLGFVVGSLDTSTLSFLGVVTGGASSLFQAMYNVIIKRTLQYVDNDPNVLLFYNLCLSTVLFIPLIYIAGEKEAFQIMLFSSDQLASQRLSLLLSGILATALNLASYWCVKVTSPLTFTIVGFTKSIVQTIGGIIFLSDIVSPQSLSGIILSLTGSGAYSYLKVKMSSFSTPSFPPPSSFDTPNSKESEMSVSIPLSNYLAKRVPTDRDHFYTQLKKHDDDSKENENLPPALLEGDELLFRNRNESVTGYNNINSNSVVPTDVSHNPVNRSKQMLIAFTSQTAQFLTTNSTKQIYYPLQRAESKTYHHHRHVFVDTLPQLGLPSESTI